jgi:hypothetical protein
LTRKLTAKVEISQLLDTQDEEERTVARVKASLKSRASELARFPGEQVEGGISPPTSLIPVKRGAEDPPMGPPNIKQQAKWSPGEDKLIIKLRGSGMKWEEISKRLPGRSATSCRLHYQNYLERRSEWDEDKKDKLARLYER